VFAQWCGFEAASCPRHQTLNEDINFGLHVNAPLRKHFVACSGASTVAFSTTCLKSSVTFCWRVRVHVNEFWFWNRVGVHVDESVKAVQALRGTKTRPATPSCPRNLKKEILVFDFLKFPLSNRKKNSRFARFLLLHWVGERCSVV
jgi:hypothetical protein